MSKLFEMSSEEEFDEYVAVHINQYRHYIHFMIELTSSYAHDISRRNHPFIWGSDEMSIESLVESLNQIKQKFVDLGVPLDKIVIGSTFVER
jgi:hypothetical protein